MSLTLLVLELSFLAAAALGLHAVSRRYGLVPLLVYLAGLVAILQGLGAVTLFVAPWPGVRIAMTDVTLVPVVLLVFLVLYDAEGAAVARTAMGGVVGVSFVALTLHLSRMAHLHFGGHTEAASAVILAPNLRFVAASIAAFLVGIVTLVVVYQGARNHLRFLPMGAVRTLALIAAAAADTGAFRALALSPPVALAGLVPALAGKGAALLLLAPAAAWYLARVASRLPGYVGPEDRGTVDVLFGWYGRQQGELRSTKVEMRRTEERLRETRARFRHTFELAAVGIIHTTPDGTILLANPAVASFLGYPAPELEHREVSSLTVDHATGEDAGGESEPVRLSGEYRFRRADGAVVWGHTTTTEVRDEAGRPSYNIVVIEDVTKRRRTEERLRRVERLEAIGQLTGGVAHDFNNLLTVIIGDTEEAISRSRSGGDAGETLAPVLRAARRGAKLTQHLLAYAGQQVLQPELLDCERLLQDMSDLLKLAVGGGIEVQVSAGPGLAVAADRTHLETALLSLAANAREAMPHGGVLTVRAFHGLAAAPAGPGDSPAPPTPHVTIEVIDTGRGMTPEAAARAFEPFFTTKGVGEGSGLGLSMVYGFARQSGGHVEIDSAPGRGTTVRLQLPAAADARAGVAASPTRGRSGRGGETILVVEDDPDVARVLAHTLERLGYRVSTARDATQARRMIAKAAPGLVIADVMLPGKTSGADLAAEIGRDHPGVPVLFVSGYSAEFLQDSCRLPVGAEVLRKPYESSELARRVCALLDGSTG